MSAWNGNVRRELASRLYYKGLLVQDKALYFLNIQYDTNMVEKDLASNFKTFAPLQNQQFICENHGEFPAKNFNIWEQHIAESKKNEVRYFKTNSGLRHKEYAYLMEFQGEYFCIGIDAKSLHDSLYQVGNKYEFEPYELEHINQNTIDIITNEQSTIVAQKIKSAQIKDIGSEVFTQDGHKGKVVGVSLDVMLAEVSISYYVLISDKIEKIEPKKLFSQYSDFLLYKTMNP